MSTDITSGSELMHSRQTLEAHHTMDNEDFHTAGVFTAGGLALEALGVLAELRSNNVYISTIIGSGMFVDGLLSGAFVREAWNSLQFRRQSARELDNFNRTIED